MLATDRAEYLMLAHPRISILLDELERFHLPVRVRRDPLPEKKPPRANAKPIFGDFTAPIDISMTSAGLITYVGGDDANVLMLLAQADGCRSAVSIAAWMNERGYRGRGGGEWSKQSVTRISTERSQEAYEARLAEHTATIRQGLKIAKSEGCHSRNRAAALNAQGLCTFSEQEWDRKSVARWWRAHCG